MTDHHQLLYLPLNQEKIRTAIYVRKAARLFVDGKMLGATASMETLCLYFFLSNKYLSFSLFISVGQLKMLLVNLNTRFQMRLKQQVLELIQMHLHPLFVSMIRVLKQMAELMGLRRKSLSRWTKVFTQVMYLPDKRFMASTVTRRSLLEAF